MLAFLEEAAGNVPRALEGLERPAGEEDAAAVLDERACRRLRARVGDEPAGRALERAGPPCSASGSADTTATASARPRRPQYDRAEVRSRHRLRALPGRAVLGASGREAEGDRAADAAGGGPARPRGRARGRFDAERFYIVLSGLFAVSQQDLGPRRVLQPGDYFGEVALAMKMPRTASVRALTPAVVASCDQAAFDELLRPLFAETSAELVHGVRAAAEDEHVPVQGDRGRVRERRGSRPAFDGREPAGRSRGSATSRRRRAAGASRAARGRRAPRAGQRRDCATCRSAGSTA